MAVYEPGDTNWLFKLSYLIQSALRSMEMFDIQSNGYNHTSIKYRRFTRYAIWHFCCLNGQSFSVKTLKTTMGHGSAMEKRRSSGNFSWLSGFPHRAPEMAECVAQDGVEGQDDDSFLCRLLLLRSPAQAAKLSTTDLGPAERRVALGGSEMAARLGSVSPPRTVRNRQSRSGEASP
jgi:hypothetical protein